MSVARPTLSDMDQHEHTLDFFGSERRPPLVIEEAHALQGSHQGSVCVHEGAHLDLLGTQNGSVSLRPNSTVALIGTHNGSLHVSEGSRVEITGAQNGSVHVDAGGTVLVGPTGKLAGSLHVDGVILNEGIRGGSVHGPGEVRDVNGGRVKQPVVENGMSVYRW